jgi:lipopolysaccharide export system protein LptC
MPTSRVRATALSLIKDGWDRLAVYLPVLLLGVLALATYWLARNMPMAPSMPSEMPVRHEPDYVMRGAVVRSFDGGSGVLRSELRGSEMRHFPDTDTLEVDQLTGFSTDDQGVVTTLAAQRGWTNADRSEVRLSGQVVLLHQVAGLPGSSGGRSAVPPTRVEAQTLQLLVNDKRVVSDAPVVITRGADRFTADRMAINQQNGTTELTGRVRGVLLPSASRR